ncbi:amidohydrolase [Baekduia soli]|uniref:Amidohydrolase n=1 Tax=Baekduia soli TaxID=496014 RepID=A0A5B8U9T1_9ACTN|nr:amidohydrolase family protein [Baekduia soli]QEC49767.1 amidohydrolase [Baekduia soli]
MTAVQAAVGPLNTGSWTGPTIDADVHVAVPGIDVLLPHLADFWVEYVHESNFQMPPGASQIYPPGAPTTCRPEWRAADGTPAGTDLAMLQREVLDPLRVERAVVNCSWAVDTIRHPDFSLALARAINDWLVAEWLDRDPRLRASLVVPGHDPAGAATEIDRIGGHPGFVQVLLPSHSMRLYGNRLWHPMFEAIARHDLVAGVHFGGQSDGPPTPTGHPAWFLEEHAGELQLWAAQLTSVIAEGLFEKFRTLRMTFSESGFAWMGGTMWRLDKEWKGLRRDIPWVVQPPSQTIRERLKVTVQPLDAGPPEHYANAISWIGAPEMLMFASDYPHAHDQDIQRLLDAVPESAHAGIMGDNARAHYRGL